MESIVRIIDHVNKLMESIVRIIDGVNNWIGKVIAWIIVLLAMVVILEVGLRYYLNISTQWVYDVSWMLFSTFFLLGGGYTMVHKRHVRIDLLYSMLPKRGQAIHEIVFFAVMFLPTISIIGTRTVRYAAAAWRTGQALSTTVWDFPAAPIRTVIPVAFFLLLMQGIAEILRNVLVLTRKEQTND